MALLFRLKIALYLAMNKVVEVVEFRTNSNKIPPMILSRYEQQLVWDAILEEYKRLEKCINLILKTIRLHACTFRIVCT
jgi:hypothetical protein